MVLYTNIPAEQFERVALLGFVKCGIDPVMLSNDDGRSDRRAPWTPGRSDGRDPWKPVEFKRLGLDIPDADARIYELTKPNDRWRTFKVPAAVADRYARSA